MKWLKRFETHADYEVYITGSSKALPNVSYCDDMEDIHFNPYVHDYSQDYFTTVALENGTISFDIFRDMGTEYITSISYSTDNGETWTTTQNQDNKSESIVITVNVNEGDKVLWKGDAQQLGEGDLDCCSFFSSTCEFDVMGNIMSLLYGDDFVGETTIENTYCFYSLFCDYYAGNKEAKVVNANNLVLPATTLAEYCYASMFNGCTGLTSAPELPATTLAEYCYASIFNGCTGLTSAPELPATTLAEYCYYFMFSNCTSLTSAPELPATTLTQQCYGGMFKGCTSLTSAPELPATTLAEHCYQNMFQGCTSLTTAPVLPAITLAQNCYYYMFSGCTNLNHIKAMFTTTPSTTYTNGWVKNVAVSGTFVKNSAATWNVSGVNGIPTNWTVQTASA